LGDVQRVHEARARGADVEGGGVLGAEDRLEVARLRGEQPVGGRGGVHDGVEVQRCETVLLEHLQRRGLPHAGVALFFAGDAPLADAGALADPLVGGVEDLAELVVGHDARRRVAPRARQLGERPLHATAPPCANSAPMSCVTWLSTALSATRIAFLIARAGEEPWQMIDTPCTPSSGAPP